MKLRRLYAFAMLLAAGGMMFQATAGCDSQILNTLTTTLIPSLTSALNTAITGGSQSTTTTSSAISPPSGGPFNAINAAIEGIRSHFSFGPSSQSGQSGTSSSSTSSS